MPIDRYRQGRGRHTKSKTRFVVAFLTALCAVGALGGWSWYHQPPVLDQTNLCRIDRPMVAHTIVLVDTTDPLSPRHVDALRSAISEERNSLPIHGRFTLLFLASDHPFEPEQILSLCNPGNVQDFNPLYEGQHRAERKWLQAFGTPIDAGVNRLIKAPTAERSPILQSITGIGWRSDYTRKVERRRLVLVSDLLEHTSLYSQYQPSISWPAFAANPIARQVAADLNGVSVRIEYLRRPEAIAYQGDNHLAFWTRWLQTAGAVEVVVNGTTVVRSAGQTVLEAERVPPMRR